MGINADFLLQFERILNHNNNYNFIPQSNRWTQSEDDRLLYFMFLSSEPKWEDVANYVGKFRNSAACRIRWTNQWLPLLQDPFTRKEKIIIGKRMLVLKDIESDNGQESDSINGRQVITDEDISNVASLKKELHNKHMKFMSICRRLNETQHAMSNLKEQISEKDHQLVQERQKFFGFFDDDVSEIIKNSYMQRNLKFHKRYALYDKIFWVKQLMKGIDHFNEVRRILKGPYRSTVNSWVLKEKEFQVPTNDQLRDIDSIVYVLNYWMEQFHIKKGTCVTICYDAIAFDHDLVIGPNGIKWGTIEQFDLELPAIEYKRNPDLYEQLFYQLKSNGNLVGAAFVVMVMPLNHQQSFICHLYYHPHGSAPQKFLDRIKKIREELINVGLQYCGDGFDADPKYSQQQIDYFDEWSKLIGSPSACQVSKFFNMNHSNLFNDPSHILKRLRKRFIKHENLVIVPYEGDISKTKFRSLFPEIPDSVFDDNNIVSMNDWHPSRIFSAANALWLLKRINEEGNLAGITVFIMLGTMMNCISRDKALTREEQLILSYVGLFISLWGYSTYMSNNYNRKKQFILTKNMIIHCANYFYGVIGILSHVEDSFSIGRIGSINLEHFFGRVRIASGGENTHKKFIYALNRLQIIDKFKDPSRQRISFRWFDTGVVERGEKISEENRCISIMMFARDLFKKAGFVCTRECAFYQIQDGVQSDESIKGVILNVLEKIALSEILSNTSSIKSWTLHSTSLNIGKKKGRNIIGRYQDQNARMDKKICEARKREKMKKK